MFQAITSGALNQEQTVNCNLSTENCISSEIISVREAPRCGSKKVPRSNLNFILDYTIVEYLVEL